MNNSRPAVFFDRDGVLNIDRGYVYKIEDFVWMPGAIEAIRRLNELGWRVFVFTNQSGIARGYYTEKDVKNLHDYMKEELKAHQAQIDAFYYCPHSDAPEIEIEKYRIKCRCRKPAPGMIEQACAEWMPIDKKRSFAVGDRKTDIEAAQAAGLEGYLFEGGDLAEFVLGILEKNQSL